MPRASGSRRTTTETQGDTANFVMKRPKLPAHVTSSSSQKVGSIKEPLGPTETWVREAFGYYNVIGEVAFVMNLTADTLSRCEITPVEVDDSVAPGGYKETTDERVRRVWDAFLPASGGKPELYRKAALQVQIAGESMLVGLPATKDGSVDNGRVWSFKSSREIQYLGKDDIQRDFGSWGGKMAEKLPPGTDISRFFRSDPEFENRADCALRHLLPICQEVVLLSQVVDAIATSNIPAGILFVPDEMSFGPEDETEDDSDETDQKDPFTEELISQLRDPVRDRTSAASLVPLIMRGPGDMFDKVKLIDLARNIDTLFTALRKETIHRLAVGLDVPPEMLEGKSNLSHWGSYNVDSQFINDHVKPLGILLCEFLAESYLRTNLVVYEKMTVEEASKYSLKFDASKITSKTDASGNARALWDRVQISNAALLRENGFDESDAPSHEEMLVRDMRNLMEAEPVVWGPTVMTYLYPELKGVFMIPGFDENGRPIDPVKVGETSRDPSVTPERKNATGPTARTVRDQDSGQGEPAQRGPAGSKGEEAVIDKIFTSGNAALKAAIAEALTRKAAGADETEQFSGSWDDLRAELLESAGRHFHDRGFNQVDALRKANAVTEEFVAHLNAFAIAAVAANKTEIELPRAASMAAFNMHETASAALPVEIRFHSAEELV